MKEFDDISFPRKLTFCLFLVCMLFHQWWFFLSVQCKITHATVSPSNNMHVICPYIITPEFVVKIRSHIKSLQI